MKHKMIFLIPLLSISMSCSDTIDIHPPEEMNSPTLLFTSSEIDELKNVIASSTGSMKTTFDNLLIRCENGLLYIPRPYVGNSPMAFYDNFRGPSGLVRNLALGYVLTDDNRYAVKAIEIMKAYAEACAQVTYTQESGTGMLLARSLYPLLCGYDLLRHGEMISDSARRLSLDG